jgi:hypothetical protein
MEIRINAITGTLVKSQIMRISRAEIILTFHSTQAREARTSRGQVRRR